MKAQCEIPLLVRGDIVGFQMDDRDGGDELWLPGDWGLIHDPVGDCIPKCTLMIAPYRLSGNQARNVPQQMVDIATDYFGRDLPLDDADLVIPLGPWDRVGRVVRIYYDRYGHLKGPYQHPFKPVKPAVSLYRQRSAQVYPGGHRAKAFRLSLPDQCLITEHGFVWP